MRRLWVSVVKLVVCQLVREGVNEAIAREVSVARQVYRSVGVWLLLFHAKRVSFRTCKQRTYHAMHGCLRDPCHREA